MFWKVVGAAIGGIVTGLGVTYFVYPYLVKPAPITDAEIRNKGYIRPEECPK